MKKYSPEMYGALFFVCVLVIVSAVPSFYGSAGSARSDTQPFPVFSRGQPVEVMYDSQAHGSEITFTVRGFDAVSVEIEDEGHHILSLPNEAHMLEQGYPELPVVVRSIIIPDDMRMMAEVTSAKYIEYDSVSIAPSKGNLNRMEHPDPSQVPYEFGAVYQTDEWYPQNIVSLREPYIIRDFRGQVVEFTPFQYNPVRNLLRVYTETTVTVYPTGRGGENVLTRERPLTTVQRDFAQIYQRQFINYEPTLNSLAYTPVEEEGNMLVISPPVFADIVEPLVEWKNTRGLPTELVTTTETGTTTTAIKNYISDYYDQEDLTYVLLVGDQSHIPTFTTFSHASDPTYSFLVGNDYYPDIFVGRFSGANAGHIETQVERSINYEQNPDGDWRTRAMGIASNEGSNPPDWLHMRNIRDQLYASEIVEYTWVDEFYDGSQGGDDAPGNPTAAMVSAAFNDGRHLANYAGHGYYQSISTSGFTTTHINALTNTDAHAFFITVACLTGAWTSVSECFGEAWLRATHNGEPSGGIGAFCASRSQAWRPPMTAQNEMMDVYVGSYSDNIKTTTGGIAFNGVMRMNDVWGSQGNTETAAWHLFGDPSIVLTGDIDVGEPPEITITRPDGGETFNAGDTESVTWIAEGGDDPVDHINLYYSTDAGDSWHTIATGVANTGTYSWAVPNEHSTDCLVRGEAVDTQGRRGWDESDGTFTIVGTPPSPPSDLEVIHYGMEETWSWLYDEPHRTTPTVATGLTGAGVFHCAMRLEVPADEIREIAFYALDQPTYVKGFIHEDGPGGTVPGTLLGETESVSTPGPNAWVEIPLIQPVTVGPGHYWAVLEISDPSGDHRPMGRYSGHIDDNAWISTDGSTWSELQDFGLDFNHAIEILTATWDESGSEHNKISWTASVDDPDEISHYNLYRSESQVGDYDVIEEVTADGSPTYSFIDVEKGDADEIIWWYTVRAVGENGLEEENTVQVPEPGSGEPPSVTLTRPTGGETFTAGASESITWSTAPGDEPILNVDLFYSVDGGSWQTIESGAADTGTYTWTVPNEHSEDVLVRVRARDTAGRTGEDVSDSAFTIVGVPPAPPSGLSVVHYGEGTAVLFSDDVSQDKGYTTGISNTGSEWGIRDHGSTVGDNSWDFGDGEYFKTPSYGYLSWLISPEIEIPAEADSVELSFDHWRSFGMQTTYLDGGNLKISATGVGGTFTLLTPNEGYDGAINDGFGNPLGGQQAWGGTAGWETVTFDLTAYAGQTVNIRWDAGIEAYDQDMEAGWRIDNILVTAEGIPFEGDEDNLLTWNASPDDPGTVSHYNIYRSEAPEGPWDPVDSVDADGSPEYQYLDEGRGMADEIYWWYLVRAVGTNGAEEENIDAQQEPGAELTTMDIELYAGGDADGWNLVSFNLILANTNLEAILADISGDYDRVMYYDAASGIWRSHIPGRPSHYNNLESWDRTMGVWIRTTEDTTLTVEGARPESTSVTLYPGWNLVGLPSETSGTHGLPVEVDRIGYFHASEEYNMAYTTDVSSFVFEPGKGYWVYNDAGVSVQWDIDY